VRARRCQILAEANPIAASVDAIYRRSCAIFCGGVIKAQFFWEQLLLEDAPSIGETNSINKHINNHIETRGIYVA
jgi:hypothetical protein